MNLDEWVRAFWAAGFLVGALSVLGVVVGLTLNALDEGRMETACVQTCKGEPKCISSCKGLLPSIEWCERRMQ